MEKLSKAGYTEPKQILVAGDELLELLRQLSPVEDAHLSYITLAGVSAKRKLHSISTYGIYRESDNKLVATASLHLDQKFSHNCGIVARIEDVVVDKDFRGEGLGETICQHLIEESKGSKAYKIILDCDVSVVPFYEKLGFKLVGNCMRLNLD